ncbi:MAG TPA: SDR family oxidoreductase [Nocardioidaceae bacterium]|nr:SDR family oxidoreductase [Nocardioidaceae bacterium]
MTYDVNGKVVLITGAARGIGAQTARLLAGRGARLALVGLEPDNLAALVEELGSEHAWWELDVTDQEATDRVIAAVVDEFGGIDVAMTNAGIASYGTVRQIDPTAFQRVIDINLTGMFRTAHAALPHLVERRGYILVVASLAAFSPLAGMAAYDASKAGAEAFALSMRQELLHLGVDVGVCHPSWIDTDLVRDAEADLPSFRETRSKLPWPANTTTSVEDCAQMIADGIAQRARRIYVPKSVVAAMLARPLTGSGIAERVMRRQLARMVPRMEEDAEALGRSYGKHQTINESG